MQAVKGWTDEVLREILDEQEKIYKNRLAD
jgi:hypothetical protein